MGVCVCVCVPTMCEDIRMYRSTNNLDRSNPFTPQCKRCLAFRMLGSRLEEFITKLPKTDLVSPMFQTAPNL